MSEYLRRLKDHYLKGVYTEERILAAYNGGITRLKNVNYDISKMPRGKCWTTMPVSQPRQPGCWPLYPADDILPRLELVDEPFVQRCHHLEPVAADLR